MAGKTHTRLSCPCCGMMTSPGRLDQDFPVKFASVTFRSGGRDKGFYHWDHQPHIPNRLQLLSALREKLTRCIDMLDLELDLPELLPYSSALVQPAPTVRFFPRPWHRCHVAPVVRLNPILNF